MNNENIIVFDTETINLEKAFCYNLGYVIANKMTGKILEEKDFVIKQIYENKPLFATSYYANKKPLYTHKMKARTTKKICWGRACQEMLRDMKKHNVTTAYAYNSPFDTKVFDFNHNFFKNKTKPLDNAKVIDIMDYINIICNTKEYFEFCKANNFMTKHSIPQPQRNAEKVFAFLTQNVDYAEEHTALEDSKIELAILLTALALNE